MQKLGCEESIMPSLAKNPIAHTICHYMIIHSLNSLFHHGRQNKVKLRTREHNNGFEVVPEDIRNNLIKKLEEIEIERHKSRENLYALKY